MSKFNAGDKVIYNGSINEMFNEEFTVGFEYEVFNPAYKTHFDGSFSIQVNDPVYGVMVFMREDNFDLLPEETEPVAEPVDTRYDNGDVVTVDFNSHGSVFKDVPVKATLSRKTDADYLATTDDGQNWYVCDDQLSPYAEPVAENDSQVAKRKLLVASFADRKGNTITIKRSKCRHYYLKKPGKPQVRIAKNKIGAILGELASSL